jgi:hypothetical protein
MQRQDDSSESKAQEEDDGTKTLTTRGRGGSGLDSIVSGLREQEERRQRSTPKGGQEDPSGS